MKIVKASEVLALVKTALTTTNERDNLYGDQGPDSTLNETTTRQERGKKPKPGKFVLPTMFKSPKTDSKGKNKPHDNSKDIVPSSNAKLASDRSFHDVKRRLDALRQKKS